MPSRVIRATVSSGANVDKAGGTYITFAINSDTGPADGVVGQAVLSLSSIRTYSSSFYLNVIYGGNSGTIMARTGTIGSNSSTHSEQQTLSGQTDAMVSSSVSTLTLGVVATSGSGNKINIRQGCTLTLTIEYSQRQTPCGAPTAVSVSPTVVDAGASATLSWSGATAGVNNRIANYVILRSTQSGSGYALLQSVDASASSVSVTAPDAMGAVYYYKVATMDSTGAMVQSTVYASLTARTYTACGAPTAIAVSANNVAPGAGVTLSWSGASAGTNNAIAGYQVCRSTSAEGPYSLLTSLTTSEASGSVTVSAPEGNGASYYYRVLTVGSRSGYDSGESAGYAVLTCVYSAPSAPTTVTIGGGESAYALPGETVTLAWSGAGAGINNAISGYDVYLGAELYAQGLSADTASLAVPVHATPGGSYNYAVITLGVYANSAASAARTVYTCTHPTAPTAVGVSNAEPDAGTAVTLSWSGAAAGSYNAITAYRVYRATAAEGPYQLLATVTSTAASASCSVTAPDEMGATCFFKVETAGVRSASGLSVAYASVTARTYGACARPSALILSASAAAPGAGVTLSWEAGGAGVNNPVTGYAVYRKEGSGSYSLLQTTEASVCSLSVTAPDTPGASHMYYVITLGTKSGFNSPPSDTVTLSSYAYTACGAPASVTLSASIAESSLTLSWSGASAGTANPIAGYRIRYQDSDDNAAWGASGELQTVSVREPQGSLAVEPPPARGAYRRFSVQTLGTADGYDSQEALCQESVRKNRLPPAPTFLSGSMTYTQSPLIRIRLGEEPDGQTQTLMLAADDGDYEAVAEETRLQNLSFGGHVIRAYSVDSLGAASETVGHTLDIIDSGFTDPVIVPLHTFVKAVHINELRERVDGLRAYYGLEAFAWSPAPVSGETGLIIWRDHILELRQAAEPAFAAAGTDAPAWTELPVNTPKAAAIDELREAVRMI